MYMVPKYINCNTVPVVEDIIKASISVYFFKKKEKKNPRRLKRPTGRSSHVIQAVYTTFLYAAESAKVPKQAQHSVRNLSCMFYVHLCSAKQYSKHRLSTDPPR